MQEVLDEGGSGGEAQGEHDRATRPQIGGHAALRAQGDCVGLRTGTVSRFDTYMLATHGGASPAGACVFCDEAEGTQDDRDGDDQPEPEEGGAAAATAVTQCCPPADDSDAAAAAAADDDDAVVVDPPNEYAPNDRDDDHDGSERGRWAAWTARCAAFCAEHQHQASGGGGCRAFMVSEHMELADGEPLFARYSTPGGCELYDQVMRAGGGNADAVCYSQLEEAHAELALCGEHVAFALQHVAIRVAPGDWCLSGGRLYAAAAAALVLLLAMLYALCRCCCSCCCSRCRSRCGCGCCGGCEEKKEKADVAEDPLAIVRRANRRRRRRRCCCFASLCCCRRGGSAVERAAADRPETKFRVFRLAPNVPVAMRAEPAVTGVGFV